MPTYVSLFAGIGGLDLAVEAHGYECVAQVEWDAACTRVLERWWPTVPRWGDVAEFTAASYASSADGEAWRADTERVRGREGAAELRASARPDERVDLIVGGFPCQPVSTAGRRKAGHDERWLWPEFARVVGELRPRAVLIENVRGLLSAGHVDPATGQPVRGSAFGEVLADLADLGYDATWTSLRASDVGACHRRERVFVLATDAALADGRIAQHEAVAATGQRAAEPRERGGEGDGFAAAAHPDDRRHGTELRPPSLTGIHASDPGAEPGGADRGLAAADADQRSGRVSEERRAGGEHASSSSGRVAADTDSGSLTRPRATRDGLPEPSERGAFPWGAYGPAIARAERAFGRAAPWPVDEKGRLDPVFVEWMQGFPKGWTSTLSRTQALKALGNAVVPQQGAAALSILGCMASDYEEVMSRQTGTDRAR